MSLINTLIKTETASSDGNFNQPIHKNPFIHNLYGAFVSMLMLTHWRITAQTRNMTVWNWSVEETKLLLETQTELNDVSGLDGRKQCSNEEAGAHHIGVPPSRPASFARLHLFPASNNSKHALLLWRLKKGNNNSKHCSEQAASLHLNIL